MSVATFSIDSFANIRFPAKNERFVSVNAYILLILGLSLIITFLLSFLNVATIDYSLILILASGFLYVNWLLILVKGIQSQQSQYFNVFRRYYAFYWCIVNLFLSKIVRL